MPGQPFQVLVDAGGLPPGVREDGAVGGAVEGSLARHERHDGGLDAPSQADDGKRRFGLHHASASLVSSAGRSSAGASPPGVKYPSSVAYLTSRARRRRKRSRASGPGLEETLMTPISGASLRGLPLLLCSLFRVVSFILRSRSGVWWAAGLSTRECDWAVGADGMGGQRRHLEALGHEDRHASGHPCREPEEGVHGPAAGLDAVAPRVDQLGVHAARCCTHHQFHRAMGQGRKCVPVFGRHS